MKKFYLNQDTENQTSPVAITFAVTGHIAGAMIAAWRADRCGTIFALVSTGALVADRTQKLLLALACIWADTCSHHTRRGANC